MLHDTPILSKGFVLDEPFATCAKSCDLFSKPSTHKKNDKRKVRKMKEPKGAKAGYFCDKSVHNTLVLFTAVIHVFLPPCEHTVE